MSTLPERMEQAELMREQPRPQRLSVFNGVSRNRARADGVVQRPGTSQAAPSRPQSESADTRYNAELHRLRNRAMAAAAQMEEGAYHAASRPGDPEAMTQLQAAEELLSTLLKQLHNAERLHQRDRRGRDRPARQATEDADGHDLRPDPLTAHNAAGLVDALRRYRIWAGEPSFREMAANSRQRAAASTMCTALASERVLPTLEVVEAVVIGCGGSEKDLQAFTTAWRRVRFKKEDAEARPDLRMLTGRSRTA